MGKKGGMEVYITRTVQSCGVNSERMEDTLWFRGHPCRQLYEINPYKVRNVPDKSQTSKLCIGLHAW